MRPNSINLFDRLFLCAFVIGAFSTAHSLIKFQAAIATNPAYAGSAGTIAMASTTLGMAVGIALPLLLWYMISRRASNVARWLYVAFFVAGVLMLPSTLGLAARTSMLTVMPGLVTMALQGAAIFCLFRADARVWFGGPEAEMADEMAAEAPDA